jgi:hypothetical protein
MGSYLWVGIQRVSDDGQFDHPHGNEVDQDGNVYIPTKVLLESKIY